MSFAFSLACAAWSYSMWKWPINTTIVTISVPNAMAGLVFNAIVKNKIRYNINVYNYLCNSQVWDV